MIIREMILEDIPGLAQLYKQFWGENTSIETMYKQFNSIRENGMHVLLSAVEGDFLVGSVMGIICEELYGTCKPFMVLENMIVDINYRNKGIGKALMSEIEKVAKSKECTQILLITDIHRIDAQKFYKSIGYNPDTHKGYKKKV